MSDTCEQKARDLLERLSDCTYYHDPQQLSAGDLVELAQMFAEIERLKHAIETVQCDLEEAREAAYEARESLLRDDIEYRMSVYFLLIEDYPWLAVKKGGDDE